MEKGEAALFLSLVAANTAGRSIALLDMLPPEEIVRLRGNDLYEYCPGVDLKEIAEFDRIRESGGTAAMRKKMERLRVRFIARDDPAFPEEFLALKDVPAGIYVRGTLSAPEAKRVSVIGSRRCSEYGKECAFFFGRELAKAGLEVVSGMAMGVDGYAGRGALEGAGRTSAVLGGGPDICYPRENIGLYTRIMEGGGCVISEKPPGYEARPYDFPKRNRLISAYSRCLAVVEASERSGTHSTVEIALSLGRDVFAVPGRIGERMSRGCNELIRSGAHILTCPEDILQFLGVKVEKDTIKKPKVSLKPEEKRILDLIESGVADVDGLAEKSAWPVTALLDILVRLEIRGLIRREKMNGYLPVG